VHVCPALSIGAPALPLLGFEELASAEFKLESDKKLAMVIVGTRSKIFFIVLDNFLFENLEVNGSEIKKIIC
jgi:hypothetical protein